MAEIRPFRAWRYNNALLKNIGELTSPLFDVTAEKQREELYRNPLNSIHISVPMGDNPAHTGQEGYNYHLIWLTNTEADDLRIYPTHRLIKELDHFDEAAIMKKVEKNFQIKPVANANDISEVIVGKEWTFGILFKENAYIVRLKPEVFPAMKWNFPNEIKELDLTVAHYFIIQEILGIPGKMQNTSPCIEYERNFTDCVTDVNREKAQMAIITNDVSIEDVKRVSSCGCTMPPKSTFFYPKAICGFLYCSL
jgi:uncharacterized protein (DUF1015 family)